MLVRLTVPGVPVSKGRPRFGQGRTYTPAKTRQAEAVIQQVWMLSGRPRVEGFFVAEVRCVFPMPARRRFDYPPRLDVDNLGKLVMDALNGLAFDDDSQCRSLLVTKEYGDTPRTVVTLEDGV